MSRSGRLLRGGVRHAQGAPPRSCRSGVLRVTADHRTLAVILLGSGRCRPRSRQKPPNARCRSAREGHSYGISGLFGEELGPTMLIAYWAGLSSPAISTIVHTAAGLFSAAAIFTAVTLTLLYPPPE